MNSINTICDYVEVFVPTGKVGLSEFYTIYDKPFSQLKKGDEFRIKLYGESTNYCHDMFGRERFICASDAYYEELRGWMVELEEYIPKDIQNIVSNLNEMNGIL